MIGIDNLLSKQIIQTASILEHFANHYILNKIGITISSVKILHLLSLAGSETPTAIMNSLGCTKSNISQRLNYLEKRGYITRVYSTEGTDRRKVMIKLTPDGIKKTHLIFKAIKERSLDLEKQFSKNEIKKTIDVLSQIDKMALDLDKSTCLFKKN